MTFSPIKGPEGNIEYLFFLEKSDPIQSVEKLQIEQIVKTSHETLRQLS